MSGLKHVQTHVCVFLVCLSLVMCIPTATPNDTNMEDTNTTCVLFLKRPDGKYSCSELKCAPGEGYFNTTLGCKTCEPGITFSSTYTPGGQPCLNCTDCNSTQLSELSPCPTDEDAVCYGNDTCAADEFACDNGRCINNTWKCDYDNDCGDNSDEKKEWNCESQTCKEGWWKCKSNYRCIINHLRCNGKDNCRDNSDENTEMCGNGTCAADQFTCDNGQCIPYTWKCDYDNDCGDNSDEKNEWKCESQTCKEGWWKCRSNYRCIRNHFRCNGVDNCRDNSDENTEMCRNRNCAAGWFRCANGGCIPNAWKCDGNNHCGDNSDERCGSQDDFYFLFLCILLIFGIVLAFLYKYRKQLKQRGTELRVVDTVQSITLNQPHWHTPRSPPVCSRRELDFVQSTPLNQPHWHTPHSTPVCFTTPSARRELDFVQSEAHHRSEQSGEHRVQTDVKNDAAGCVVKSLGVSSAKGNRFYIKLKQKSVAKVRRKRRKHTGESSPAANNRSKPYYANH